MDPLKIGFTGTQGGMTPYQRDLVERLLRLNLEPDAQFHHGDCIGSDDQAAEIAARLGYFVVAHPGCDQRGESPKRAFHLSHVVHPVLPYMERNGVLASLDLLIATPGQDKEQLYSGTWATVRRARKAGTPLQIVGPGI